MTAPLPGGRIEGYLEAVATQDWPRLREAVADTVVRIGPYGDTYSGRETYVRFLSEVMPSLAGYAMDVTRVTYVDDGRRAIAELTETVTMNGAVTVTPEVLLFDLDPDAQITRIEIFTRRS